jgi:hypothetical protein
MSGALPNPNVEPRPGVQLDSAAIAEVFAKIQENFDDLNSRLASVEKLAGRVVVGSVASTGVPVSGHGFASEKTATGTYKITLATELNGPGVMDVTKIGASGDAWVKEGATKKIFIVETVNFAGSAADAAFNFTLKPA